MKTVKNSLGIFILITALLSIGMPVFSPNDVNRDMSTDLHDLILSVRTVADSVETSSDFRSGFTGAVSTMKIVAGLETEISTDRDDVQLNSKNFQNIQYLIPSNLFCFTIFTSMITEADFTYKSISLTVDTPPPEPAPFC